MTTARLCAACDVPVKDTDQICSRCERQLSAHLADMPEHHRELKVALARQTRMTAPNDGGKAFEQPLVFSVPASDVIHSLRSLLVSWCRLLAEESGCGLPAQTVTTMSAHLRANVPILRRHEAVGEMVAEVRHVVEQIIQVIDVPVNRTRITVGLCPETDVNGDPCPGHVEAIVPHDETVEARMECRVCKVLYRPDQWTRAGHRILQRMAKVA